MAFGCQFSNAFSDAFEICVTAPVTVTSKGRKPTQISIATGKSIDLLKITDEELVERHVAIAGATSATTATYTAPVLVERALAGAVAVQSGTHRAAMLVDRAAAGVISASLRGVSPAGVINDDLEVLYLAGVL